MRMTVKGVVSPFGILLWYHHCPLCPDWPSIGYPQPGPCHDDARRHAEGHGAKCARCYGYGLLLHGSEGAMNCPDCDGRGWV